MAQDQIVEFESDAEGTPLKNSIGSPMLYSWEWHSKIAVDLRWVAAAKPLRMDGQQMAQILLCGSNFWETIRCDYPSFMKMWTAAKGLSEG